MKISVLTPSYNSGKYIDRAIQSVINQNYPNFEHIIADGGSTDETTSILKKYDHLKWVSERDKGQSDAMNKAFKLSNGDIITYLNADDEYASGAFKEIEAAFKKNPDADMIIGDLLFVNEEGSQLRVPSAKYSKVIQYWLNLFPNNPVSYFYKRKVQEQIGDFPVDDHLAMDIWFLLKVYKSYKIAKIDKVLGTFHSDGMNKTALAETGANLHYAVKTHLRKESPLLYIYFYLRLITGRIKSKLFSQA